MSAKAAALLAGPGAGDVLEAALATVGARLVDWRLVALHPRPGAETSAGFDVTTDSGKVYLVASTVRLTESERAACGAVRLDSHIGTVHVWQHPADPKLPGLPAACTPALLEQALAGGQDDSLRITTLTLIVLRPLRRAVVRAEVASHERTRTLFVKVVRPERARGLVRRHAMCALAPEARDLGEGLVAVETADGVPLAHALHRPEGTGAALPDPGLLEAALDSLPGEAMSLRRRASVTERRDHYASVVAARSGEVARVERLMDRIRDGLDTRHGVAEVPTHGDFHPANVFVDDAMRPSVVSALIDVDTVGPGRRAEDYASLLAHVVVLPSLDPVGYRAAPRYAEELYTWFAAREQPADLRSRVAAHLLALGATATPAHLRDWLAKAEEVATGAAWA